MRRGGGNMVEKRRAARKNLEADSLGLEPLQAVEIPQNGQSFVWKCLDENTPDLEKLAIRLQARLDSAAGARRRTIGRGPRGRGSNSLAALTGFAFTERQRFASVSSEVETSWFCFPWGSLVLRPR
jgi:hypothetical protein